MKNNKGALALVALCGFMFLVAMLSRSTNSTPAPAEVIGMEEVEAKKNQVMLGKTQETAKATAAGFHGVVKQ